MGDNFSVNRAGLHEATSYLKKHDADGDKDHVSRADLQAAEKVLSPAGKAFVQDLLNNQTHYVQIAQVDIDAENKEAGKPDQQISMADLTKLDGRLGREEAKKLLTYLDNASPLVSVRQNQGSFVIETDTPPTRKDDKELIKGLSAALALIADCADLPDSTRRNIKTDLSGYQTNPSVAFITDALREYQIARSTGHSGTIFNHETYVKLTDDLRSIADKS